MIDLHSHTNESDGTCTPVELVALAASIKLEALAISDHDTFAGYNQAIEPARAAGLDLVCAIELSAKTVGKRKRTAHILGYFLQDPPSGDFQAWLGGILADRRDRNIRLIEKLQSMGVDIRLEEVERLGRTLTGRPHFARVLVEKGYVANSDEAFRKYLDEEAPGYVERHSPTVAVTVQHINNAGGLPVLAHPVRLGIRDPKAEEDLIGELVSEGLRGLEVYHSDHHPADVQRYAAIAKRYSLAVTGGSDFHGDIKPQIALGTGWKGNLNVPKSVLETLRGR